MARLPDDIPADITPGASAAANDVGHLVMTAATIAFVLSQVGSPAAAFGWRLRLCGILSAVAVIVFGILTNMQVERWSTEAPCHLDVRLFQVLSV